MSGIPQISGASSAMDWWGRILIAAILAIPLSMVAGCVWLFFYQRAEMAEANRVSANSYAHAAFATGDVVSSRVTRFRGMVTALDCYRSCTYRVRFYAATMEPIWVQEYEIEASQ